MLFFIPEGSTFSYSDGSVITVNSQAAADSVFHPGLIRFVLNYPKDFHAHKPHGYNVDVSFSSPPFSVFTFANGAEAFFYHPLTKDKPSPAEIYNSHDDFLSLSNLSVDQVYDTNLRSFYVFE